MPDRIWRDGIENMDGSAARHLAAITSLDSVCELLHPENPSEIFIDASRPLALRTTGV